jgi:hypothetical protein
MKAQTRSSTYTSTLSFTSALDGMGSQGLARIALLPGDTVPVHILQEAGLAPGTAWAGA